MESKDSVVIRPNGMMSIQAVGAACALMWVCVCMMHAIGGFSFDFGGFTVDFVTVTFGIIAFMAVVCFFYWWNFRDYWIIFDDRGVTVKWDIKYLPLVGKHYDSAVWDDVRIDYIELPKVGWIVRPVKTRWGSSYNGYLCLSIWIKHRERALRYALGKMPLDKFTPRAQEKMIEMGILTNEG